MSYNLTQLWHYPTEDCIRSHRWGAQYNKTAPHFRCQLQIDGSHITQTSVSLGLQAGGSHDLLPLGFDSLLEWLAERRETLIFTSLLKTMIKDTDEQPDEIHGGGLGRSRAQGLLSPWTWGVSPSHCGCVLSPGSSPNPIWLGFLWRLSHIGMINY